jgi:hypothetical protein
LIFGCFQKNTALLSLVFAFEEVYTNRSSLRDWKNVRQLTLAATNLVAAAVRRQRFVRRLTPAATEKTRRGGMKKPLAIPSLVVNVWRAIMVRRLTPAATGVLVWGGLERRESFRVKFKIVDGKLGQADGAR